MAQFQRWNLDGCQDFLPYRDNAVQGGNMKRLLLIGFAACAVVLAPALPASAMPGANPSSIADTEGSIVLVRGGHGHDGGHGWGRSRSPLWMGVRSSSRLALKPTHKEAASV